MSPILKRLSITYELFSTSLFLLSNYFSRLCYDYLFPASLLLSNYHSYLCYYYQTILQMFPAIYGTISQHFVVIIELSSNTFMRLSNYFQRICCYYRTIFQHICCDYRTVFNVFLVIIELFPIIQFV